MCVTVKECSSFLDRQAARHTAQQATMGGDLEWGGCNNATLKIPRHPRPGQQGCQWSWRDCAFVGRTGPPLSALCL
jgi:hypothetical protein